MKTRYYSITSYRNNIGFTLLELLIAMAIFSIVSVISYQAIDTSLTTRELTRERLDQISRLNYVFNRMQKELLQAVDRPVLNEVGNVLPGLFVGGHSEPTIEFTHHGRIISIEPMQYTLQRTRYFLQDKKLYRQYWDVLDRVPDSQLHQQLLLDNIQAMSFEFIDVDQSTHKDWPYFNSSSASNVNYAPSGLRIFLQTETYGLISRTFVVRS
jgi:general secretion pathway protein J